MKKLVIAIPICIFVLSLSVRAGQNLGKKIKTENYKKEILGVWYTLTHKTIFKIPVYITVIFKSNKLFHINVKVLGFNYDNIYGNYKINEEKELLTLIGWRQRSNKKKKMIFKFLKFFERKVLLKIIFDDVEIKDRKKPVPFVRDWDMFD